jgi:hypothetical protein
VGLNLDDTPRRQAGNDSRNVSGNAQINVPGNAQVGGLESDKKLAHALLGIVAVIMRELCR